MTSTASPYPCQLYRLFGAFVTGLLGGFTVRPRAKYTDASSFERYVSYTIAFNAFVASLHSAMHPKMHAV